MSTENKVNISKENDILRSTFQNIAEISRVKNAD